MEDVLADLHLEDEEASENEGWQVDQETVEGEIVYYLTLVGEKRLLFNFYYEVDIEWVQIHDLPKGMFFESVAKQFRNFIGTFLDYDENAIAAGLRNYIRIRVEIDIRTLIKRRKKLIIGNGINLVGKSNLDLEGNLADMVDMDSLEEERPILSTDGKKRPETSYVSSTRINENLKLERPWDVRVLGNPRSIR
ncbi:hypothetical protein Gorai_022818 [Gossypium raimondii]|uniref:DUF4283 domain-containing protein n=1 Tax=Gossypium raimondii TaxID=29730 RepID=A0A7J8NUB5_GOSRA|nr:hypothetical protein [Gossypium raimondii]